MSFLQNENPNDPAYLRKKIAELEQENKKLKEGEGLGNRGFSTMSKQSTPAYGGSTSDKNWMNFGSGGPLERPTTASSSN